MEQQLWLRSLFYFMEALLWIGPYSVILTRFFGYREKPGNGKNKIVVFGSLVVGYTALGTLLYWVIAKSELQMGSMNFFLFLFLLIYWMIRLEEPGKLKKFLLNLAALEVLQGFMELVCAVLQTMVKNEHLAPDQDLLTIVLLPLLVIAAVVLLAKLAGGGDRSPMSNSLIAAIYIMFVLLDLFLGFFGYNPDEYYQPIFRLRLSYNNADNLDHVMGGGILVVLCLLIFAFMLMIIKESESSYFRKKNAVNEYFLETQKEHYESLIRSNREIRKIKHDMKNHVYCIHELCETGKYEELKEYVEAMSEKLAQAEHTIITRNEIADAIISDKKQRAKEKDIELFAEGDLSGISWSAIDICTVFSNMLDNAIEAVEPLEKENRRIDLVIRKNKNYLIITQSNPVEKKLVIADNAITTSKKDKANHGFGITNIKEAAAKYDGECRLSVEGDDKNRKFVFEIMVPLED